jgi:hypothetical protein
VGAQWSAQGQQRAAALATGTAQGEVRIGTREDYLTKYLPPNYTKEQYQQAVKDFEALNDPAQPNQGENLVLTKPPADEERNTIFPGTAMTYQGVWNDAEDYLLTGNIKQNPRASDPKERAGFNAIKNAANARLKPGGSIPAVRAEYAMLNGAQKLMFKNYLNTSTFVNSAVMGIDQAEGMLGDYNPSSIPIINDAKVWWGRNISGDPSLSAIEVFVYNTARDYGKATSGSAGSIQQMTDAQIKAAEHLFSLRQSPAAFKAAIQSMKTDMGNIVKTQREALNQTREGILNVLDDNFEKPWLPAGAQAATRARTGVPSPATSTTTKTGNVWDGSSAPSKGMTFTAPNGKKLIHDGTGWVPDTRK